MIQNDYTFYSQKGVVGAKEDEAAATQLTAIDMHSHLGLASAMPTRAPWPWIEKQYVKYLKRVRSPTFTLRGDPEPALLAP